MLMRSTAVRTPVSSVLNERQRTRVLEVLRSPGRPLDAAVRSHMEPRFSHDFGKVRIHTDATAAASAAGLNAHAYTIGEHVAFASGRYAPHSSGGRRLLAHELAHVAQLTARGPGSHVRERGDMRIAGPSAPEEREAELAAEGWSARLHTGGAAATGTLFAYRPTSSMHFGQDDTDTMKEESFKSTKDQPWIARVSIEFTGSTHDSNGDLMPTGQLVASYHPNAAALPDISVPVTGGAASLGFTDSGSFTVQRIEGVGYNEVPAGDPEGRSWPAIRYSKSLNASMHHAVFFNGGQAIHLGPKDVGSHSCVHVDWDANWDEMRQINYHSRVGATRVHVAYDSSALGPICCARMHVLGVTQKGRAPNPCRSQDPATCSHE